MNASPESLPNPPERVTNLHITLAQVECMRQAIREIRAERHTVQTELDDYTAYFADHADVLLEQINETLTDVLASNVGGGE